MESKMSTEEAMARVAASMPRTPVDPREWSPDARRALATLEALPEMHHDAYLRAIYEHARRSTDPVAAIVAGLAEVCRQRGEMASRLVRAEALNPAPFVLKL